MAEAYRPALQADYLFCRTVARREAKNFFYAFRVLPQAKSDAMCAVYAFMRKADDLADDEAFSVDERRAAMSSWTESWRQSRVAESEDPIFRALRDTQQRFGIGDDLLEQLVAGTTLDLHPIPEGVRVLSQADEAQQSLQVYRTLVSLHQYCYLVASVVGLVCIRIFGYTDPRAETLAIDTGIAFQLTNILRDVREDAERGRLYLSEDVLAGHGLDALAMLRSTQLRCMGTAELAVMRSFEREARGLYRSAELLIPLLDEDARAAMRMLTRIYHRLLDRFAEDPAAALRRRVSVPTGEKLAILAEGGVEALGARLL